MKKQLLIGVLFFGAIWGLSEVVLGDYMYKEDIQNASIYLSVIGFCVLAFARAFLPMLGVATLIGLSAMCMKFLNAPMFMCHYCGILLMGVAFDLFFNVFKIKQKSLAIAGAALFNNAFFAALMYIIQYQPWINGGTEKVVNHIFVSGVIVAIVSALLVPLCMKWGESLKQKQPEFLAGRPALTPRLVSVSGAALWAISLVVFAVKVL
ncbi:MAG: hypothetical protein GY869_08395 [Planctomycetes bacterium]|nr:hypothetical protein [Planctomycetota bacterium]